MKNLNIFSLISEYDSAKSGGVLNKPNVSFVDEDSSVRYLLEFDPYNGHAYVDLGLPSGLKWATCNVGADSPDKAGLYFAWGETTGYTAEQVTSGVRAFDDASYTASAISADLTLEQDAARANLGGNWRMPTKAEYQELLDNCNVVRTNDYNGTGVVGQIFVSKSNGNSVFFPAAGYCDYSSVLNVGRNGTCWSASWNSSSRAWYLFFNSGSQGLSNFYRVCGYSVRGVCE